MVAQASKDTQELTAFVDKLISARNISRLQYQQLSAVVLADGNVDENERLQINRLFDAIREGIVRVSD
ncbi:MAG: hypothetical protein F6K42_08860 [Leptolyngbya sp. SIO1D8]|nr:hypothetical protein [Leptolyngbya sp. SIO1D8]